MTPPFSYLFLTNSAVVEGIRMWGEESRTGTACVQSRKKRKSAGEWKNPQRLVVRNVMKALFFFYRTTPRNYNTQKTELLWLPHGTSVRLPFNTSAGLICALKHIKTNIPSTLLDLLCWQMIDVIPEARLELNKLVRKTQGHKHRMHLNEKMAISSFAFWAITQVSYIHIYAGVHVQYHLYVCSKKVALSVLTGIQNRNEAHEQKEKQSFCPSALFFSSPHPSSHQVAVVLSLPFFFPSLTFSHFLRSFTLSARPHHSLHFP